MFLSLTCMQTAYCIWTQNPFGPNLCTIVCSKNHPTNNVRGAQMTNMMYDQKCLTFLHCVFSMEVGIPSDYNFSSVSVSEVNMFIWTMLLWAMGMAFQTHQKRLTFLHCVFLNEKLTSLLIIIFPLFQFQRWICSFEQCCYGHGLSYSPEASDFSPLCIFKWEYSTRSVSTGKVAVMLLFNLSIIAMSVLLF